MGGDVSVFWHFYRDLIPYLRNQGSLLNLGSGISFAFETFCRQQNNNLAITCVDRLQPKAKPEFIDRFVVGDIESDIEIPGNPKFDVVCFFEVLEHVDRTDAVIKNAIRHCRAGGLVMLSFPNLASIYARIELLLGFQPHVLEVSNERANLGAGFFGRYNNPKDQPIHHIRGITSRAGKELAQYHGLKVREMLGTSGGRFHALWKYLPGIAPVNVMICELAR